MVAHTQMGSWVSLKDKLHRKPLVRLLALE
jgi:hypothetical protein